MVTKKKSPDVRMNSFTDSVKSDEAPQLCYSALAETRLQRSDGMVNLFTLDDITKVNRHPGVLGQGGGGTCWATPDHSFHSRSTDRSTPNGAACPILSSRRRE